MTEPEPTTWAEVRKRFADRFDGKQPNFVDDTDIANAFAKHPAGVIAELEKLSAAYDTGRVYSPWRAMVKGLAKLERDLTTRTVDSDLRVRQAEAWIRNAGLYCVEEAEVLAELFSNVGGGKGYSGGLLCGLEAEYGEHMLTLWKAERPRAIAADRAFLDRAARNRKQPAA